MSLSLDHVSASLQLHRRTLESKLTWTRQRLVQLAALLPYAATITTRNVGSHARTIINLSALMGRAADSAQAAAQQAAPPPALQAPQQQVERLQGAQQTAQPAAEDAARQKRPRLASAAGPSLATAGSLPADAAVPDPEGRPEEPAERSRPEQAAQSKEAAREQQQAGVT